MFTILLMLAVFLLGLLFTTIVIHLSDKDQQ